MDTPTLFISLASLAAGIVLLIWGIVQFLRQRARLANSIQAQGVVIELLKQRVEGEYVRTRTKKETKLGNKYRYRPVVEFETDSGRKIQFSASIAQNPAPYQVGDSVTVLYQPNDPDRAQIQDFVHLWLVPILLITFGLFLTGMGAIGLLRSG